MQAMLVVSVSIQHGKKDMRLNPNRPMPCINDPGDAIIKVTATAICGSDLHIYNGVFPGMCKGYIDHHVSWPFAVLQPADGRVFLQPALH